VPVAERKKKTGREEWSGRSDLNRGPSAPKAGEAAYGSLWNPERNICFELNVLASVKLWLLIPMGF
jgi:hypothetical protein